MLIYEDSSETDTVGSAGRNDCERQPSRNIAHSVWERERD